jgi:hypothetical protein
MPDTTDASSPILCWGFRVPGYWSRGPGFDSRHCQIFWEVAILERGPLSLVSTIEELLGRNCSGSGLESRDYCRKDLLRWPCDTLYPQKLALTSPTSGGRTVGIGRSRTKATEFSLVAFVIGVMRSHILGRALNVEHLEWTEFLTVAPNAMLLGLVSVMLYVLEDSVFHTWQRFVFTAYWMCETLCVSLRSLCESKSLLLFC